MSYSLYAALLAVAVAGLLVPASAQLSDHVVINEVETNPRGDDAKSISEWVELYNPTESPVDLNGWEIASTGSKKVLRIPVATVLQPGDTAFFSYTPLWFVDARESVELRSANGTLVDKTPDLTDRDDDFKSWQRIYDGHGSDSADDWKFALATADASNGKPTESQEDVPLSVSVDVEKQSYVFGETAVISGSVSEEAIVTRPVPQPAPILIVITGPDFEREVMLYPDTELGFETSLSLHRVLGIEAGSYDVSVTYSDAAASAAFTVGDKESEQKITEETAITITTDRPSYVPGQTVSVAVTASKISPSESMRFDVTDPDGKTVENGNLFSTDGKFSARVFLTTVDPAYGTYEIKATFLEKSATATFEVSEKARQGPAISLATNQTAYAAGDTITVTGSLNHAWEDTLDLSINQAKVKEADNVRGIRINTIIGVEAGGSFEYSFDVPGDKNGLGDYLFRVSGGAGSAEILIPVVEDPESFVRPTGPLSITLDSASYEIGQTAAISGHVSNPTDPRTGIETPVSITISEAGGGPLQITVLAPQGRDDPGAKADYTITAIPRFSGSYGIDLDIAPSIFGAGDYVLTARHSEHTARATFAVSAPPDLNNAAISLDRDVYGLGQTVTLAGTIPNTATSADIKMIRPDGSVEVSTVTVQNQRIAWTWEIPDTEQSNSALVRSAGDYKTSNLGVYEIQVSFDSRTEDLSFKVSLDPENDSLSSGDLTMSIDKDTYRTGERLFVTGNVGSTRPSQESATQSVELHVYQIYPYDPIQVHDTSVFPEIDGSFSSMFELPAALFSPGSYGVRASYLGDKALSVFVVGDTNDSFSVSADSAEYLPGSTVVITGTGVPDPGRLVISAIRESDSNAICGTSICGSVLGTQKTISVGDSFEHELELPENSPFGRHEVMVASGSLIKPVIFDVVEELTPVETAEPATVIEGENRITDGEIVITAGKKTADNSTISPRVLSGSMIVNRGDEAGVNLAVYTEAGTCVIGQKDGCLVSESTRRSGGIYDTVDADGASLKVRYSGPDVRLEKFSILPESADEFLPDMDWKVEIEKDEQISRFYYKITYKTSP